ncbi:flagellar export chaperone FlgN [Sinomonas halotolerans]|uniref:Flagellar export chaperone FlgN n=1 Tax=Sinomonas halotolerans TaxID=1644133 RepID=A0ABU9WYS6_9MICC
MHPAQTLSTLLWRERELLDRLTYRLETEQLLISSGHTRWIGFATEEVAAAVAAVRDAALETQASASALAGLWGLPDDAGLPALVGAAPEDGPWREVLTGHLEALTAQASEVELLRDANAKLLRAATRDVQETLAQAAPQQGPTGAGYDAAGHAARPASPHFLDQRS